MLMSRPSYWASIAHMWYEEYKSDQLVLTACLIALIDIARKLPAPDGTTCSCSCMLSCSFSVHHAKNMLPSLSSIPSP